jgi:putative FmdB family regulatory protein
MPSYEYQCKDCHGSFDKTQTLAAHDTEPITCPSCGSENMGQELTTFFSVPSKKSA